VQFLLEGAKPGKRLRPIVAGSRTIRYPPRPAPVGHHGAMTQPPARLAPAVALRRIAFLLERALEPTYKVRAFRRAAAAVDRVDPEQLARLAAAPGGLRDLPGIGEVTERVIREALAGEVPVYLRRLEATEGRPVAAGAAALRAALRGDCHTHSDWSDGGSPIAEMAEAARGLGHEYIVLSDHSPRLTVANGLSPERLAAQLEAVAALNRRLAGEAAAGAAPPFRVLTGIEVDILEDGSLDQEPALLERLDLVVASVHSKLRMPAGEMTPRMLAAIANPHTDVLGHVTGRIVRGRRGRPESQFDPEAVFAACAHHGVAVEVNARPERQDPPKRLLRLAVEAGCVFAIDTDAHAPGQLDWQLGGCERAFACGVEPDRVVNARDAAGLLEWATQRRR
jgi:putative hydrolase